MSLPAPLYWLLGYLLGSLPFALWITRLVKGVDVRDGGSGHVTTTNTIRQAGWFAGALVFALDFGKGFLAVWLAAFSGLVVAVRFTIDWNRKYRELWLDREKKV